MKDIKYTIGISLVVLAFISGIISVFFLLFGLPVFLVGAALILFSNKKTITKVFSLLIPLVLYFPSAGTFLYFYSRTTPETFLIPGEFRGSFRVVYGEDCGVEPKRENGRRILEIPLDGVLILKPEFESGTIDHEYYFLTKDGGRIRIPSYVQYSDTAGKNNFCVLLNGSGTFNGQTGPGSFSSESPLTITYSDFYFLAPGDTQNNMFDERFDSLTKRKVDVCRLTLNDNIK